MLPLERQPITLERIAAGLVALILWAVTIGLGLLAFIALPDIILHIAAFIIAQGDTTNTVQVRGALTTVRNCTTIISGILLMIVMVGGTDYHMKKFGQKGSWHVFAWTLGLEAAICLTAWVLVWR